MWVIRKCYISFLFYIIIYIDVYIYLEFLFKCVDLFKQYTVIYIIYVIILV